MKIMVVSPHPDDETLGAGGLLLKHKKAGDTIFWLNITDISVESGWDGAFVERRKEQIEQIKEYYTFEEVYNLKLPPTKLSDLEEGLIIKKIRDVFDAAKPECLIIPGAYDAHSDHFVVYNSCMAAAKSFRAPYISRIMTMEILSETEYGFRESRFEPNLFVDITDEMDGKIEAMKIYDTEVENPPFPRSIEGIKALATYRGGACARKYAEAFHIIKQVE